MNNRAKIIFLLLFFAFFGNVQANVTTLTGSTVSYTFDDSLLSLFGVPTLSGDDRLFFTPTNFAVNNGNGFDFQSANMNITVNALNGGIIYAINLMETGNYIATGDNPLVDVKGNLQVTDLNKLLPDQKKIALDNPIIGGSFTLSDWSASTGLDFTSHSAAAIKVSISNTLTAFLRGNQDVFGFIEKTGLVLGATAAPASVPLPASLWLFGSALLGFLTLYRTKAYE